jgi:6-phosphogluconolactonase
MLNTLVFAILITFAATFIQAFPLSPKSYTEPWILYVALQSTGILTITFDPSKPASTSLQIIDVNTDGGFMPGWLTTHNDKIYSVSRTDYPNNNSVDGGVFGFQKQYAQGGQRAAAGNNYGLGLLTNASTGGEGGVACDVTRDGRTIGVANM